MESPNWSLFILADSGSKNDPLIDCGDLIYQFHISLNEGGGFSFQAGLIFKF